MAYSDGEVAAALVKLAINKYDYQKTSDQLGIPKMTLRRWNKKVPKRDIAGLLEHAIEHLLASIPEKMTAESWAIALGILMDKWLLVQGKATSRNENISRMGLNPDELDDVLAEAERILDESARSGGS